MLTGSVPSKPTSGCRFGQQLDRAWSDNRLGHISLSPCYPKAVSISWVGDASTYLNRYVLNGVVFILCIFLLI